MRSGLIVGLIVFSFVFSFSAASAQDVLPRDNGLATYHTSPRYRESESHPLRVVGYVLHPVGWLAREVIFRPFSYLASSTETTRSVLGYREPFDYRQPECFSADDSVPDCRSVMPFNYDSGSDGAGDEASLASTPEVRQVYFPDVNFDFNKHKLSDLGSGQVHRIADMLKKEPGLKVVLEGNADFKGTDEYNNKLSMNRVEAVKSELLTLGVSADRLSTLSFGEAKPLYSEQEDWARAVNRRVEVRLAE